MADTNLSPLEILHKQKEQLRLECQHKEEDIRQLWKYVSNNGISITTRSITQAINPFSSSGDKQPNSKSLFGKLIPTSILILLSRKILSSLFRTKQSKSETKDSGISNSLLALLGIKSTLFMPIATLSWAIARPLLLPILKNKLDLFIANRANKK